MLEVRRGSSGSAYAFPALLPEFTVSQRSLGAFHWEMAFRDHGRSGEEAHRYGTDFCLFVLFSRKSQEIY